MFSVEFYKTQRKNNFSNIKVRYCRDVDKIDTFTPNPKFIRADCSILLSCVKIRARPIK